MTDLSEGLVTLKARRDLPGGHAIDETLWLRMRGRLMDVLMREFPTLKDGQLADATDAACVGLVEHSELFRERFSRWYAAKVLAHMNNQTPEELIRVALEALGEDGSTPTAADLDYASEALVEALNRLEALDG